MAAVRLPSTDKVDLTVHDLAGNGPPLILCHATGFHGMVFEPLAAALASSYRLFAVDFRAHGGSSRPTGRRGLAWDGFAEDVAAVVDGLGLERSFGFGHSMGGAALLLPERARPATFSALYCFEPIVFPPEAPPGPPGQESPLAAVARRRRQSFATRDEAYANFAAKPPLSELTPAALRAYVEHGLVDQADGSVRLACRAEDEAEIYRMATGHGAFDRLGTVACPVTVAAGARTDAVTPEAAAVLAGRLPHGRVEIFGDLGHFAPLEDPLAVARAVVAAFLDAATPG
jgi:pimeloyl-ACP methyl ester carboxylesterase